MNNKDSVQGSIFRRSFIDCALLTMPNPTTTMWYHLALMRTDPSAGSFVMMEQQLTTIPKSQFYFLALAIPRKLC